MEMYKNSRLVLNITCVSHDFFSMCMAGRLKNAVCLVNTGSPEIVAFRELKCCTDNWSYPLSCIDWSNLDRRFPTNDNIVDSNVLFP